MRLLITASSESAKYLYITLHILAAHRNKNCKEAITKNLTQGYCCT